MVYPQKRVFYRNKFFKLLSPFFAIWGFLGRLFLNVLMEMPIGCKILVFSCKSDANSFYKLAKSCKSYIKIMQLVYILYLSHLRKIEYETEKKCKVLSPFTRH